MHVCVQENLQAQCTLMAGSSTALALQDSPAGEEGGWSYSFQDTTHPLQLFDLVSVVNHASKYSTGNKDSNTRPLHPSYHIVELISMPRNFKKSIFLIFLSFLLL